MSAYQQRERSAARHHRGMTLVEALSAVSIVLITLSLAAPAVSDLRQKWRHHTHERLVHAFLRQSRSAAVSSMMPVVVCGIAAGNTCRPDGDWQDGMMSFIDTNENNTRDADDTLLRLLEIKDGGIRSAKPKLQYNALGGGDMGRLEVCTHLSGGYKQSRIHISLSGRTRVTDESVPGGRCQG